MSLAVRRVAIASACVAAAAGCDSRRTGTSAEGPYAQRVAEAIPRIERAVGVKFKQRPKLELRSRDQVRDFLVKKLDETTPARELKGEEAAFKVLGLIPDSLDLRKFLVDLLTEQIVGYYDPADKVLYVVEGAPDDLVGTTITHELVHALQDQYINLDSLQKATGSSDRQSAAQAVIEGQATYEQLAIMLGGGSNIASAIPGGWNRIRETIRENQGSMPKFAAAPMAIQESILFPYLSGAEFIRRFHLHVKTGLPFDSMPVSTEQILHERAYFGQRDAPTAVVLPAATGAVVHESDLGEFGARLFLFQHTRDQRMSTVAAEGWDGDRYRIVRLAGGNAIVWVTVWDSAMDAAQFVDALGQATGSRYNTGSPTTTADGARTFTGATRTVVITPREIDRRNVVMYVDVPKGASANLIDLSNVVLRQ